MQQVMRKNIALLLFGDAAAFFVALFLSLALRHGEVPDSGLLAEHLMPFSALIGAWLIVFFIAGLYDAPRAFMRAGLSDFILRAQVINMLLAALVFFLFPVGITPKTVLAVYLIVSTGCIALWRLALFPRIASGSAARAVRAVIVGSGDEARAVSEMFNGNPRFGFVCERVVDIRDHPSAAALGTRLTELVSSARIDCIIADMGDEYAKRLSTLYYELAFLSGHASFVRLSDVYEQLFRRVALPLIGKEWFLEHVRAGGSGSGYRLLKRLGDIALALVLLVPTAALFPFIALTIKLQDGGRAIYASERVSQYNKPVWIYKFRTMTGMDSGATLGTKHAVTPVGRFLRKARLDELPQLWNILRGDLSFVGPRPEIPARAALYAETIPYYNMRHLIKPGLSGWAQINDFEVPRGEVDVAQTINKLSYDLYYLKHRSLFLDIEIALKTIKTMLLRSGS